MAAKNLVPQDVNQGSVTVAKFDTSIRTGLAYRGSFFRLGADLDLTENESPLPLFPQMKSRMLSVGAEFNAFDFAQLRVGMQRNIASNISEGAKNDC